MKRHLFGLAALTVLGGAAIARQDSFAESTEGGVSIAVSLSARELTVESGGSALASYPVAIGSPNHPTPTGNFRIRHIVWNPRWVPPDAKWARNKKPAEPGAANNPMGRVKLFFSDPDYYIHGTREVDSLGQAESHGCLRMRNADAIALAKVVMENGGSARPPSWFHRVLNRVTSTQEVFLSTPVAVTIVD